ncbi:MAG: hypothetical protein HC817_03545 [Saprospiraceae bacterium]|nr:hypothetical protein [Saprospiraceae bacterium]
MRYMDDMILWDDDKVKLKQALSAIQNFTENPLKLTLKPHLLNYSHQGLPFLGYQILPNQVRLTQNSKHRFFRKTTTIENHYHAGDWQEAECQRHILPLLAFAKHADTEGLLKKHFNI